MLHVECALAFLEPPEGSLCPGHSELLPGVRSETGPRSVHCETWLMERGRCSPFPANHFRLSHKKSLLKNKVLPSFFYNSGKQSRAL